MKTVRKLPASIGPAPWFVIPTKKRLTFSNFSDSNKTNCARNFPEIHDNECLASMHGWVIMKRRRKSRKRVYCSLWNPDTRELVSLPPCSQRDFMDTINCILSSPPTRPNCMVLFWGKTFFLFWKLGDRKWTRQEYQLTVKNGDICYVQQVISTSNGNLYAFCFGKHVGIIDSSPTGILSLRILGLERPELYPEAQLFRNYLVESCGEIFLVVFHCAEITTTFEYFEIFKMDLDAESWLKVESLGDRVFCLSHTGSVSFSASKSGMEGNKIYFWEDDILYAFGLEDESLSRSLQPKASLTPFWWMPQSAFYPETHITPVLDLSIPSSIEIHEIRQSKFSAWSELHADILLLIGMHLPLPEDYIKFRCICKSTALSAPPIRLTTNSTTPTQYPWLMFTNRNKIKSNFLDLLSNDILSFDIPEIVGAKICYAKDRWLLMYKGENSTFFLNPFTKSTVPLPAFPPNHYPCSNLSFSSSPSSPSCIVFGISIWSDTICITYLRIGDREWTFMQVTNTSGISISDNYPVYYNNEAFYCLGHHNNMGIFNLKDDKREWITLPAPFPRSHEDKSYLVLSNGHILSVVSACNGKSVHVYKLEDVHEGIWNPVTTLEDQVLFLSRSASISVKATTEEMRNNIFSPISLTDKKNYLFYSLQTCRWHSSSGDYSGEDINNSKELLHCAWIKPTLVRWKDDCSCYVEF